MTGYILRHEAHFRAVMEEQLRLESSEQIRIRRKRLERNENRIAELKRLFIRIYEDNACGRLSDERFDSGLEKGGQAQTDDLPHPAHKAVQIAPWDAEHIEGADCNLNQQNAASL